MEIYSQATKQFCETHSRKITMVLLIESAPGQTLILRRSNYVTTLALMLFLFLGLCNAMAVSEELEGNFPNFIKAYCAGCHGTDKPKADLNLARLLTGEAIRQDLKIWEAILQQLKEKTMPPENKPQPTAQERERAIEWINHILMEGENSNSFKDPGRVVLHRLSRFEYNNTIRDLLGVDSRPADNFPSDGGGGGGFDNNADTLFIAPILMEKYLDAAMQVVDQAKPERLFIAKPGRMSKRDAARKIVAHFALRAFRRPPEKRDINRYFALFEKAIQDGRSFESAVKESITAILVSPQFLFRIEEERNQSMPYQISDYELASRLSYFLWSSMPDDELFHLAKLKQLHKPEVLQHQVTRMLQDPKGRALAENFASQWLDLRSLKTTVAPDTKLFPGYTPVLRDSMYEEPITFFRSLLLNNGSVFDLLDSNYAFVNETLASHYGLDGVKGSEFQRIALADENRGGVLGMGGVLTLTSFSKRTSPVLRGKWVLEEILGARVPPPPQDVGGLPNNDIPKDGVSFRQRLELHRKKPQCSTCHSRMDPIGFGLENYDAIGRWRTEIYGYPVDSSGVMPDGNKFNGPVELKRILMKRREEFARNVTEKMLSYALGRGLEFSDRETIRAITEELKKSDYKMQTLIVEIAKSYPFQWRKPSN